MSDDETNGVITEVVRVAVETGREPREVLEAMRDEGYITADDDVLAFWTPIMDRVYQRVRDAARGYTNKELQDAVERLSKLDAKFEGTT